jgi:subtilisin family serine protease
MNRHTLTPLALAVATAWCLTRPSEAVIAGDPPQSGESLASRQKPLFDRINLDEAWQITKGDPKVVVGVIDNGFDFFHPDLKRQMTPGYYYPGGYHTEFYEGIAHGTIVTSLIVAREGRADGMVGLAPRCKALCASQGMIEHTLVKLQEQYFRDHPQAGFADWQKQMLLHLPAVTRFGIDWARYQVTGAAAAIRYLVDHGVRVINFSGGLTRSLCPSPEAWQHLEEAVAYAASKNVVIVLAAGNNAARWEDYPGDADTVIVAGASRLNDTRWEEEIEFKGTKIKQGSNYGKRLTVMAPVERLVVCVPHEPRMYVTDDGPMGATKVEFKGPHDVLRIGATSSAAPVVSSLVALVCSARPDLDARAVVAIVKQGADDIGEEGYDAYTGHGRVNYGKTVRLAREWKQPPASAGPAKRP